MVIIMMPMRLTTDAAAVTAGGPDYAAAFQRPMQAMSSAVLKWFNYLFDSLKGSLVNPMKILMILVTLRNAPSRLDRPGNQTEDVGDDRSRSEPSPRTAPGVCWRPNPQPPQLALAVGSEGGARWRMMPLKSSYL